MIAELSLCFIVIRPQAVYRLMWAMHYFGIEFSSMVNQLTNVFVLWKVCSICENIQPDSTFLTDLKCSEEGKVVYT